MFEGLKRYARKVKHEWKALDGWGKAKIVLGGMAAFGLGWIAADFVDDEHGPVVTACTYVGATGLATGGAMLSYEALGASLDAMRDAMAKETDEEVAEGE